MPKIAELRYSPLTGARQVSVPEALMDAGGIVGHGAFVLFDPARQEEDGSYARVSRKQYPPLAQVNAELRDGGVLSVHHNIGRIAFAAANPAEDPIVYVNEFGDLTPVRDAGDFPASFFTELLGHPVRLGQKTPEWRAGEGPGPVAKRNVAALHLVLRESVDALGIGTDVVGRFRPNIVVEGYEPGAERGWLGKTAIVGHEDRVVSIGVDRHTARCKVTGQDELTGEPALEIPKLFKGDEHFLKVDGKPVFGVYGHPHLEPGADPVRIRVGDEFII